MTCARPGVAPSENKIVWMVVRSVMVIGVVSGKGKLFNSSKESELISESDIDQIASVWFTEFVYFRGSKVIMSGGDLSYRILFL